MKVSVVEEKQNNTLKKSCGSVRVQNVFEISHLYLNSNIMKYYNFEITFLFQYI